MDPEDDIYQGLDLDGGLARKRRRQSDEESGQATAEEMEALREKLQAAKSRINALQSENLILVTNMSCLYMTARNEVSRKNAKLVAKRQRIQELKAMIAQLKDRIKEVTTGGAEGDDWEAVEMEDEAHDEAPMPAIMDRETRERERDRDRERERESRGSRRGRPPPLLPSPRGSSDMDISPTSRQQGSAAAKRPPSTSPRELPQEEKGLLGEAPQYSRSNSLPSPSQPASAKPAPARPSRFDRIEAGQPKAGRDLTTTPPSRPTAGALPSDLPLAAGLGVLTESPPLKKVKKQLGDRNGRADSHAAGPPPLLPSPPTKMGGIPGVGGGLLPTPKAASSPRNNGRRPMQGARSAHSSRAPDSILGPAPSSQGKEKRR
ncbi:unnamed protein product [Vitrella brassicaformis CCMP3155]|uniref:Uncharacterized protein n=1 Tax=Vitrella brassicaformis (strain CCMP3155) TaxID=1169540 RepID=A0A0G4FL35_VITBC|nr:unnamed protein product [Vitrella brassicaformis CCMP3155]|mmetsp:Transcript_2115/g.5711  ORF Transcript_2115/g.5711 Transcript_2115/m.5711 type:complete len:376 (+) Transcript_2115:183-1310(+)|eukprot:CEM14612.1 unnamed protein product [Vitrella brassicaformis CCMP3155]